MIKTAFLFAFITVCPLAYNQIIKGSVQDLNSGIPINYATAYFNGTFLGTYADQNGYFEIDISKNKSMSLIISALGYYSVTVSDPSPGKFYKIYLEPKEFVLNEVTVSAKGSARSRRERKESDLIFKPEFLGRTMNAMKCEIINEGDITLNYNLSKDTLKAMSSSPIIIHNRALGYKITYFLDKFEFSEKGSEKFCFIQGNYFFEEDSINQKLEQKVFERRRKSAYFGSTMHFIRELFANNLDSAGFIVKDIRNNKLTYERLVHNSDGVPYADHLKYFKFKGNASIAYYSKSPSSFMFIGKDSVGFTRNRVINPRDITWSGEMALQRIGDLLPFEYDPKSK